MLAEGVGRVPWIPPRRFHTPQKSLNKSTPVKRSFVRLLSPRRNVGTATRDRRDIEANDSSNKLVRQDVRSTQISSSTMLPASNAPSKSTDTAFAPAFLPQDAAEFQDATSLHLMGKNRHDEGTSYIDEGVENHWLSSKKHKRTRSKKIFPRVVPLDSKIVGDLLADYSSAFEKSCIGAVESHLRRGKNSLHGKVCLEYTECGLLNLLPKFHKLLNGLKIDYDDSEKVSPTEQSAADHHGVVHENTESFRSIKGSRCMEVTYTDFEEKSHDDAVIVGKVVFHIPHPEREEFHSYSEHLEPIDVSSPNGPIKESTDIRYTSDFSGNVEDHDTAHYPQHDSNDDETLQDKYLVNGKLDELGRGPTSASSAGKLVRFGPPVDQEGAKDSAIPCWRFPDTDWSEKPEGRTITDHATMSQVPENVKELDVQNTDDLLHLLPLCIEFEDSLRSSLQLFWQNAPQIEELLRLESACRASTKDPAFEADEARDDAVTPKRLRIKEAVMKTFSMPMTSMPISQKVDSGSKNALHSADSLDSHNMHNLPGDSPLDVGISSSVQDSRGSLSRGKKVEATPNNRKRDRARVINLAEINTLRDDPSIPTFQGGSNHVHNLLDFSNTANMVKPLGEIQSNRNDIQIPQNDENVPNSSDIDISTEMAGIVGLKYLSAISSSVYSEMDAISNQASFFIQLAGELSGRNKTFEDVA